MKRGGSNYNDGDDERDKLKMVMLEMMMKMIMMKTAGG